MNILVLVKPVVEAKDIKFNSDMTLDRSHAIPSIDMADAHAISLARNLLKEKKGTLVLLTLSPGYPTPLIAQFRSYDANAVYQISDRLFAGSDSLMTAKILAAGIRYLEHSYGKFDRILAGVRSTDAETGQVPSEIAALMSRPVVSNVVSMDGHTMARLLEDRSLLMVGEGAFVVSCCPKGYCLDPPSLTGMAHASFVPYILLTNKELGLAPNDVGLKGSPTRVIGTSLGIQSWRKPVWTDDPKIGASWIREAVRQIQSKGKRIDTAEAIRLPAKKLGTPVFVMAPLFDVVGWGCAMEIMSSLALQGKDPVCIAVGDSFSDAFSEEANTSGACRVVFLHQELSSDDAVYGCTIAAYFKGKSGIVLAPATIRMRSILPYAAALLHVGLTADCTGYAFEDDAFIQIRPAFEGTSQARIVTKGALVFSTVRPHVYVKRQFAPLFPFSVETVENKGNSSAFTVEKEEPTGFASDGQERVVMSIGAGIMDLGLRDRITRLGYRLGASRKAVNLFGIPYAYQIGQTGMIIHADLYVAFGISGAAQHITGISAVKEIIAVNPDRKAPIFQFSDKAICCKAEEVIGYLEQ